MRKPIYIFSACAVAVTVVFVWSQTVLVSPRAGGVLASQQVATMGAKPAISPLELMASHSGQLSADQWDAF